jgi:hypothetical protein
MNHSSHTKSAWPAVVTGLSWSYSPFASSITLSHSSHTRSLNDTPPETSWLNWINEGLRWLSYLNRAEIEGYFAKEREALASAPAQHATV